MLHRPFSRPSRPGVQGSLPSIEEFLDDLPSIEEFVETPRKHVPPRPPEMDQEGWANADWQGYDWNALAALGARTSEEAEAEADWSATDWTVTSGSAGMRGRTLTPHTAAEVAKALDAIADRIRSGELPVDKIRGTPPEAAMAAAFAALMRLRR